jgi:hypothetical protein
MLIKEAKEITGGLSAPGKMPEGSYNLPARACLTGAKLVKVRGSTCSGCYALKGNYIRYPAVQKALNRRLKSLESPLWVEGMIALTKKKKHFRWHDSGDIQSAQHLKNIFEICKATPQTKHWLPTREAQFLKYLDPDVVPKNLKIIFSDHMNDQARGVSWWPYTSGVETNHKTTHCPAFRTDKGGAVHSLEAFKGFTKKEKKELDLGHCGSCRQCWDRGVKRVIYGKH